MDHKLSKLMKNVIILNVVLTLIILAIHSYNVYRIEETDKIIQTYMTENKVIRDTAIYRLERKGVDLFLNQELTTYFGVIISTLSLFLLITFGRKNGFIIGFSAATSCFFTSFIGGLLMFYIILSGKSQVGSTGGVNGKLTFKNDWERYIHNKSDQLKTPTE